MFTFTRALGAIALVLSACSADDASGPTGPGLALNVSALTLDGVAVACYDVAVTTASGALWSRGDRTKTAHGATPDTTTLCSDTYGGAGAIAYVGTCDAAPEADTQSGTPGVQNDVTLWIDGLYGSSSGPDIGDWRDPCGTSGCKQSITCVANADALASFDLTVMRSASQGFFDVAVTFGDVFCSAKFDTCKGATPNELLFGDDVVDGPGRDWTGVMGLACTGGPDAAAANISTSLLFGTVAVTCPAVTFELPITTPGNHVVAIDHDGNAQTPARDVQYAIYAGDESLLCNGQPCNNVFLNVAIDLEDLPAGCTFSAQASAESSDAPAFTNGAIGGVGKSYPVIAWDAIALDACGEYKLDGASPKLATLYAKSVDLGASNARSMCARFDGSNASAISGASGCGVAQAPVASCTAQNLTSETQAAVTTFVAWFLSAYNPTATPAERQQTIDYLVNYMLVGPPILLSQAQWTGQCDCAERYLDWYAHQHDTIFPISFDQFVAAGGCTGAPSSDLCAVNNGGCGGATPGCYSYGPWSATCVVCTDDADCAGNPSGETCRVRGLPQENTCVGCLDNSDCSNGEVCNTTTLECVQCLDSSACGASSCTTDTMCVCDAIDQSCEAHVPAQAIAGSTASYAMCSLNALGEVDCYNAYRDLRIPLSRRAVAIASGGEMPSNGHRSYYSCAILETTGGVECWGRWEDNGAVFTINLPGAASAITVGQTQACALVGGAAYCWGNNSNGQLGDGTTNSSGTTPRQVSALGTDVAQIEAGDLFTCARMLDGSVKCWGQNAFGQLGDGTQNDSSTPVAVQGLPAAAVQVSAGGEGAHNYGTHGKACALLANNEVWCWGILYTPPSFGAQTTAAKSDGWAAGTITRIDVGAKITCGVFASGLLQCVGYNDTYQIPGAAQGGYAFPQTIIGLGQGVTAVAQDFSDVCAILVDGTVKCWGGKWWQEQMPVLYKNL